MKILFICLGNICRSPAAEAIMQKLISERDLSISVDSAGTSSYHQGERADSRMRQHGERRGLQLLSLSRPFTIDDFERFDFIFCMDRSNQRNLLNRARNDVDRQKVQLICDYARHFDDREVPDPYYGGDEGFEHVFNLLEDACEGALEKIT